MKDVNFFNEAKKAAQKSTCLKIKNGAVIVKGGKIIGRGTNLCSPVGFNHGKKVKSCPRKNLPSGEKYELCKPLHAELVAILNTGAEKCRGAVMYFYGHYYACWHCRSVARYVGIKGIKFQGEVGKKYYKDLERTENDSDKKADFRKD